jgi:hypothetical protein
MRTGKLKGVTMIAKIGSGHQHTWQREEDLRLRSTTNIHGRGRRTIG